MTYPSADTYAAFRINLEQQQKRAKELLKAAKAGDADALWRLQCAGFKTPDIKLAQAQHCIAQELRFANWVALKQHCTTMDHTRSTLGAALDADCRTMHIRCGHDIQQALLAAGLHGDFNLHVNPYLQGPVTDASNWLELRARFIVASIAPQERLDYFSVLKDCVAEEQRLATASREYERVVLWFEHDRYDQFVLLRCLAWFAEHGAPPQLELASTNDFPGAKKFVGLSQLPPEALCLLWQQRTRISPEQLAFGHRAWAAFRSPDPRLLAQMVRDGTPLLPDLATALHRHLQELPSRADGLGLTQRLLLRKLAEQREMELGHLIYHVMQRDPLPGLGDTGYVYELLQLQRAPEPLVLHTSAGIPGKWGNDKAAITRLGRSVLLGGFDARKLALPERWVGGIRIAADQESWWWDEEARDVL
jgi:hypothetical protein